MNISYQRKKTLFYLFILFLFSNLFSVHFPTSATAKETAPNFSYLNYKQGVSFSAINQYNDSTQYFSESLKSNPNSAATLTKLGSDYILDGKPNEAIPLLLKASLLNPNDPNIYLLIGIAQKNSNNTQKALESFQKALSLDPNNSLLNFQVGITCKQTGDNQCAINSLNKIIALYENALKSRAYIGAAYHELGQFESAENNYKQILVNEPNNVDVIYNLAKLHISKKNYTEASKYLDSAILLNPGYVDLYLDKARINYELMNYAEAQNNYKTAISQDLLNPQPYVELGDFLVKTGAYLEAAYQFDKALELELDNEDLIKKTAYYYQISQKSKESKKYWEKLLVLNPKDETALFNLGYLYLEKEDYLKAIDYFKNSGSIDSLFGIAYCYQKLSKPEDSRIYYNELIKKQAASSEVYYNLALLDFEQNKYSEAITNLKLAEEHKFTPVKDIYEHRILCYEKLNDTNNLNEAYKEFLNIEKENIEFRLRYAEFLRGIGNNKEALNQFLVASTLDTTAKSKLNTAKFLVSQKDFYGAIDQLHEYLKSYQDDIIALNLLAQSYETLNLYDQAINAYKRIILLKPSDHESYYKLGYLYEKGGKIEEAKNSLLTTIELNNEFAKSYYILGLCYLTEGDKIHSKELFEKYLKLEPNGEFKTIAETKLKEILNITEKKN